MTVLVAIDKLSMDGSTPSCLALNIRDTYPAFAQRGCRIAVCGLRARDPGADLLEAAGIPVVRLGLPPYSPRIFPALCRVARHYQAGLIHAHGYASANFGRLAGRRLRIPVFVHEHAILPVQWHQYVFDGLCRTLTTRGIAVSKAVAEFMVRGRCVPRDRIEMVPNGIDVERFRRMAAVSPEACRQQLGLPVRGPLVGSVARFRREKGLHVLVEAAGALVKQFPEMHIVLAGEGPERKRLEALVAQRGLHEVVLFPGFIADVPRLMRALTLLAIPSLSEGLAFVAQEAMAAGTPIVASRTGGLPEIIEDGVTGLLCPPGEADALAATVVRLLRSPDLSAALAEEGRRASALFSMDRYAERMVALYRAWMPGPPPEEEARK